MSARKRKTDYESPEGFSSRFWGPGLWNFLHTVSFNYPVKPTREDRTRYMEFIRSLRWVLPCGICRRNYSRNLKSAGFGLAAMKDRHTFSRFVYRLHKEVGFKGCSYYRMRDNYETFRAKPKCRKRCDSRVPSRCVLHCIPASDRGRPSFTIDERLRKRRKTKK